jgi:hypothetical protein
MELLSMAFVLYLLGVTVLLAGVGWFLTATGFAALYIVTLLLVLLGLGVAIGESARRRSRPPPPDD